VVDAACDRFEGDWQAGVAPCLDDYLKECQGGQNVAMRRRLLRELILIDLEYRWRRDAANSDTESHEAADRVPPAPAAALSRFPARPLLEDYFQQYPELNSDGCQPLPLIKTEYRVRQQWGDRPRYPDYRNRFPHLDDNLEAILRKTALKLSPTMVRVYHEQELVFSREYASPLEIGRQRAGEPPPYGMVSSEGADRIIIAPAHDQTISRNQLYVEIVARNEFWVENRSAKSNIFIESDVRLTPGEGCHWSAPVDLLLGSRAVRLAEP
jgi:hypothetical protein